MAKDRTEPEDAKPTEPTMASILEKLVDLQSGANVTQKEQLRQTSKKSNQSGALRSPFNPRGDKDFPLPALKCEMWIPFKVTDPALGGLDREEVDLLNLIEPGEYPIIMNDESRLTICIVGTRNTDTGTLYKMEWKGPRDEDGHYTGLFTQDRRNRFPSLKLILRQMVNGIDETGDIKPGRADTVITMREETRRIRLPDTDPLHLPVSVGE